MARLVQLVLVVAGAALLVALVRAVGVETLAAQLRAFGAAFVVVIALELVLDGCNTLAWRATLDRNASTVGFWRLFWIREAGTAINQLTPTATFGGEVVKAMLLRPRVGGADAVASVVAAKLSFAIGQLILVLVGLAAILARLERAPGLRNALLLVCALSGLALAGFLVAQRRGLVATATATLTRLGAPAAWLASVRAAGADLDARLARLHRERPGAFATSIAWHFGAQLVGTLQLFYVLGALGAPASLTTCLAIEALALVVDSAVFFVPGRIGVQEGGRVLVFTALGLRATTGLAVALIVRLNQLALAAVGLAAFAYFSLTSEPLTGSISET